MVQANETEKFRKKVYNALVPGALLHGSLSIMEAEQEFFKGNDPLMLDEALEKAGYRSLLDFVDAHPNDIRLSKTQFGLTLLPGLAPPELIRDNMRLIRTTARHNRPNPHNMENGIMSHVVQRRLRYAGHRITTGMVEKKCLGLPVTGGSYPASRSSAVPPPPSLYRPATYRPGISRYSSSTSRPSRPQYRQPATIRPRLQSGYFQRFVATHIPAAPSINAMRSTTTSWSQMQSSYGTVERTVTVQTSSGFACNIPQQRSDPVIEQVQRPPPMDRGRDSSPWDMPTRSRSASTNRERTCEPQVGMSNEQFLASSMNRFRSRSARGGRCPRLSSDVVQDDWTGDGYENEFHNHSSDESDDFAIPVRKIVPYELADIDPAIREVGPLSPVNVPSIPADQHPSKVKANIPAEKVELSQPKRPETPKVPAEKVELSHPKRPETPKVMEAVCSAVPLKDASPSPSVPCEPKEDSVGTEHVRFGHIKLRRRVPGGASGRDSAMSEASSKITVVRFSEEVKVHEVARKESFRRAAHAEPLPKSIEEQPEIVNPVTENIPANVVPPPETRPENSVIDEDRDFHEHRSIWRDRLKTYCEL